MVQVEFLVQLLQQVEVEVSRMALDLLEVQVQVVVLKVGDLIQEEQVILHQ